MSECLRYLSYTVAWRLSLVRGISFVTFCWNVSLSIASPALIISFKVNPSPVKLLINPPAGTSMCE